MKHSAIISIIMFAMAYGLATSCGNDSDEVTEAGDVELAPQPGGEEIFLPFTPFQLIYTWSGLSGPNSDLHATFGYRHFLGDTYVKDGETYYSVWVDCNTQGWVSNIYVPDSRRIMGIRMEDGCVYVNKEEYLGSIDEECRLINESGSEDVDDTVGDKSYLPYRQTENGELVLYDFHMKVGDKYPHVQGHEDVSVVSVERCVTLDGVSRRLLTLSNGYQLLEGVGCINSPGMFFYYLNPSDMMKNYFSSISLTFCSMETDGEMKEIWNSLLHPHSGGFTSRSGEFAARHPEG